MPQLARSGGSAGDGRPPRVARRLRATGVVQGVGFRPFVYNLARRLGLDGWVRNTSSGVEIHVEGPAAVVEDFPRLLTDEKPPRAFIATLDVDGDECEEGVGFVIAPSAAEQSAYQLVSPDIAVCDDCRRELLDPADRRYRYPFTNCTNCGPRFTIIEDLPYDRERTTMRVFAMCPDCRREYEDPADRRFHAEPDACPVCGPNVMLVRGLSGADGGNGDRPSGAVETVADRGNEPITAAAGALREGRIVAVKGLGGFHLACDATDGEAVLELKRRKGRPHKPLAVMFADLGQVRRHCRVDDAEAALLQSVEAPIVLVEWRGPGAGLEPDGELGSGAAGERDEAERPVSPEVAVRQRYLGVMLPYTPLHVLLLREAGRPLVMTSGNLAEEPIVKAWDEIERLSHIPDLYLVHDRDIYARYDDSVAQVRRGRPRLVRRSRGYAPFPVRLPRALPQVLACGAELKNTFCLTRDDNAFLSQHIGDLENLETLEHFEASIDLYERLFRLEPEIVAYDLHPEYLATKYAQALDVGAAGAPREKIGVQHHHAHVVACLVENGRTDQVIGVSLDGLGYGDDGALWGGEILVCDLLGYRRAAHLEYLPLAGGALAIQRPARTAAGWLAALLDVAAVERARRAGLEIGDEELTTVLRQVETGTNAPLTSSCGRLFDCLAALAGVRSAVTYEAQAAIELEMVSAAGAAPYPFDVEEGAGVGGAAVVRLGVLLEAALADLEAGGGAQVVGSRLHAALAAIVLDVCRRLRAAADLNAVALSGGCFQNRLLSELCEAALEGDGFEVLTHARVPANDGGLALGQAAVAGYTVLSRRGLLDESPDPGAT